MVYYIASLLQLICVFYVKHSTSSVVSMLSKKYEELTLTIAPMLIACLTAANPAASPPITRTLAGGTFPAAVDCPVKNRPKWFEAFTTALKIKKDEAFYS